MQDILLTPTWCPALKAQAEERDPVKVARGIEVAKELEAQRAKEAKDEAEKG
jgi:hypothetical protein